MTIKELYEKYQDQHVIYFFQRKGIHIHVKVTTVDEKLIKEHILKEELHAYMA